MSGLHEIVGLIESQGTQLEGWGQRLDRLEAAVNTDLLKAKRESLLLTGRESNGEPTAKWIDTVSRRPIEVLRHADRLAKPGSTPVPSVGRFLRGLILGGRADDHAELAEERKALGVSTDVGGGYAVAGALAEQWIDNLRSAMVLSRAGVSVVPMDTGSLSIAKVVGDPAVSWHAENAALTSGDPTFGQVNLRAKTCCVLVRLSLELSQDSSNIEQILQSTLTNALAAAIDKAGLVGETVDSAGAPAGIMNASGRNTVLAVGAPVSWDWPIDGLYELQLDNVPLDEVGALIGHPAIWRKMRKLKTGISGDNSSLVAPAEVAALPKYWSTAAPFTGGNSCKAIVGNWSDLIFGVRKQIDVRILQEAFLGSNLQLGILAYSRVDFVPAREASFCTMEGITV